MRGRPTIDDDGRQKRVDRSRSRIPLWASSSCCLSILFRSIDRGDTFARFDERTKQLKAPRARVMRRCDDASLLRSGARSSRRRRSPDWQRRSRSSPSRSCRRFALESPCWIDDASSRTHVGSAIPIRGGASAVLERREEKKNELSFAIAHSLSLSLSLSLAHLPRPRRSLSKKTKKNLPAVPQDHHHQEEARARREAEQADPAVDPLPHGQQDQVQRQAPPLEAHQARVLEEKERERGRRRREDGCFFCARLSFPLPLLLFPPRAFLLTSV